MDMRTNQTTGIRHLATYKQNAASILGTIKTHCARSFVKEEEGEFENIRPIPELLLSMGVESSSIWVNFRQLLANQNRNSKSSKYNKHN